MAVYDEEKEKTLQPKKDGSHDDLGTHPERREAEIADLEDQFNSPSATGGDPSSSPEAEKEQQALEDKVADGSTDEPSLFRDTEKNKLKGRGSNINTLWKRKGLFVGGGIAGLFIAGFLALFSFLLPYKITHIINSIEQRVGQVPEYAIERRLEFYMNRYLILKTLEANNVVSENNKYTYIGDGVFRSLYNNWQGAKIEVKLAERGYQLRPIDPGGDLTGGRWRLPSQYELIDSGVGRHSALRGRTLDRPEARRFIKEFAKSETRSHQIIKRFHMRTVMRNYYGVTRWKPFEKQRTDARNKYIEKKTAFKKYMVDQTVGKVSERYGNYFNCLVEGGEDCKRMRRGQTSSDRLVAQNELEAAAREVAEEAGEATGEAAEKAASKGILKKIQEMGLRKILASVFAAATALEIANTTSKIITSLDEGTLNQVVYAKNSVQYMNFAAPFLSGADQIRSGEDFDQEDVEVISEIFNDYEKSPVYQAAYSAPSVALVENVSAATNQISRDCDGNGTEELLAPGETVCPDKKLVQDKTAFTNSEGWQQLASINEVFRNTAGAIIDWISDAFGALLDFVGVTAAIENLMEITGIQSLLSGAFEYILNWIVGPVISGTEVGGDAYEGLLAGITVGQSSLGGGVGEYREDTIGGGYLTPAQVASIRNETSEQNQYELQQKSHFARYFSPEITQSLTSQAIMAAPTSLTGLSQKTANLLSPVNAFKSLGSLFTGKSSAQTLPYDNPFGALFFGFSSDHEIFTANDGAGMEPEEVNQRYECAKPASERPQNQVMARPDGVPFDVFVEADPCLLEVAVENAGSMYFTGEFDRGLDGSEVSQQPSPVPDGVVSPADIVDINGLEPGRGCHVSVASKVQELINEAASAGINLGGTCWRDSEEQIRLRQQNCGPTHYDIYEKDSMACSPPTAKPGSSDHEKGLAIDFRCNGGSLNTTSSPCYAWLKANAARYDFYDTVMPSEPWHWAYRQGGG